MNRLSSNTGRRSMVARLLGGLALLVGAAPWAWAQKRNDSSAESDRRWIEAAIEMKRLAESWGDQPYGAVVVLDGSIVGNGPSRVVKLGNADAHAEREAIRDAQKRLGRYNLNGAVLYSTSRPCSRCESAAAEARIARMVHGSDLKDAGPPKP